MNNVAMIKAETALLQNGRTEAETILLQAGLPLKAIMLNLQLFQFEKWATPRFFLYSNLRNIRLYFLVLIEQKIKKSFSFIQLGRALELAVKHDSNIDVVVAYRRKYLEQFSWTETIPRFIEYAKKVIHAHILLHYSKIIRSDYTINDSITRILLRYYSYIADGQTESYTISFVSLATGRHRLGRH
jgi:hypothetical protein